MNTSKKTAFGILGVAATTALIAGASMPALADDHDSSTDVTTTKTRILESVGISNDSPFVVNPDVSTGDVHTGDILSGNANGNEVGNGNVVGSGNDTVVGSGNTTAIDGIDAHVSDLLDSSVGDISGHVNDLIGDLDLGITNLFQD